MSRHRSSGWDARPQRVQGHRNSRIALRDSRGLVRRRVREAAPVLLSDGRVVELETGSNVDGAGEQVCVELKDLGAVQVRSLRARRKTRSAKASMSRANESTKRDRAHLRKLTGRLCSKRPVSGRPVARHLASVELIGESGLDTETSPDGGSQSADVGVHTRDSSDQEVLKVRLRQL